MQRVIHNYTNMDRIFTQIEGLYSYISDTDFMFSDILWLSPPFKKLCDILNQKLVLFKTPEFKLPNPTRKIHFHRAKKTVVVCLSGGKDSAAAAYYYVSRGYTVYLYHARGVNKAYGDEYKAAERIAEYLGCDLFIDNIALLGSHEFIEHPMKNMIIANGALHWAQRMGYPPTIVFGNFKNSHLDMNEFEVCGGDCIEMWEAYTDIVKSVIPAFRMEIPLNTNADTFNLLKDDTELISRSISCMGPYRFRAMRKHQTEERYNIRLYENRCGVCWKCCVEAMWLMDNGKMDANKGYYRKCLDILSKTIEKETGEKPQSLEFVWDNYMFYPFSSSLIYEDYQEERRKLIPTFPNDLPNRKADNLQERYVVPPFSILNMQTGYWRKRSEQWRALGIDSGAGRTVEGPPVNSSKVNRAGETQEPQTLSIFDPFLCEVMYKWFSLRDMNVLDPFAGGSVRGVVAATLGRNYYGVDLSRTQCEENRRQFRCIAEGSVAIPGTANWVCADSAKQLVGMDNSFDMVFTCPPYYKLERYSSDPADLSNTKTYLAFLKAYYNILTLAANALKEDSFFVIVVSEIRVCSKRISRSGYYGFVPDTVKHLQKIGLHYYNDIILENNLGSVPVRAPAYFDRNRKIGRHHQNVLIFYKGNPAHIGKKFGQLNEINC